MDAHHHDPSPAIAKSIQETVLTTTLEVRKVQADSKATISFVTVCMFVAGLQVSEDIAEAMELEHGIVHPWN